jgi:hypothetical protein
MTCFLGTWSWLNNILRKLKFEIFCMMAIIGFYLWTFEQSKKMCFFQESINK